MTMKQFQKNWKIFIGSDHLPGNMETLLLVRGVHIGHGRWQAVQLPEHVFREWEAEGGLRRLDGGHPVLGVTRMDAFPECQAHEIRKRYEGDAQEAQTTQSVGPVVHDRGMRGELIAIRQHNEEYALRPEEFVGLVAAMEALLARWHILQEQTEQDTLVVAAWQIHDLRATGKVLGFEHWLHHVDHPDLEEVSA